MSNVATSRMTRGLTLTRNITTIGAGNTDSSPGGGAGVKKRTSVLIEDVMLKRARKVLRGTTNTDTITKALQAALVNAEIERTLEELLRKGRGKFVDVYR